MDLNSSTMPISLLLNISSNGWICKNFLVAKKKASTSCKNSVEAGITQHNSSMNQFFCYPAIFPRDIIVSTAKK